jgi:prepilin peptidase CpaA
MAVGIFYHAFWGSGFLFAGKGLFLGIAFLFIPYVLGGMGAGDVKLLGAVGAFIGAAGVCKAFIFTAIAGGIHAIIFMGINGYLGAAVKRYGLMLKGFIVTRKFIYVPPPEALREKKLFYGVAIVIGTLCSVIFSHVL